MAVPVNLPSVHQDLYNRFLSTVYRFRDRIYPQDYAYSKDADVWEIIRRDPRIYQVTNQRLHAVVGRDWHIEPGDEGEIHARAAAVLKDALHCISNFSEARKKLATAVFMGRSFAFIESERKVKILGRERPQAWRIPTRLRDLDMRRYRKAPIREQQPDGTERIRVIDQLWSIHRMRYEEITSPELFITVIYGDDESRLGYGRGLLDSLYFYSWLKQLVLREGMQGLERWSQGILVGKIDQSREVTTTQTSDNQATELLDVLHEMRSRHVIVVGKDDEIDVKETSGAGHQIVMDLIRYLDESIAGLCMGSVLPFGFASDSGSMASAETESEESDVNIQFDRDKLDEDLTEDLIGWFWKQNKPQIMAAGLGGAAMPRFVTAKEKREDPSKNVEIITKAKSAGIPLVKSEVYEKLGLSEPGPDDEILEGDKPQPQFPFGNGFPIPQAASMPEQPAPPSVPQS